MKLITAVCVFIFLLQSCAPSRYVVPLNRREKAVAISYGGVIAEKNNVVQPIHAASITYGYGKTDKLTYFTGLHLTSAFEGFYMGELGMLKEWYWDSKRKLGFTTNFVANVGSDNWAGFHLIPQFDANLYWHFKSDPHYFCDCPGDPKYKMFFYLGFQNHYRMISSYDYRAPFNEDVSLSPHLGYNFGSGNWKLNTEVKWVQPWGDNLHENPGIWNPLMPTGSFSGFFTFFYQFH